MEAKDITFNCFTCGEIPPNCECKPIKLNKIAKKTFKKVTRKIK